MKTAVRAARRGSAIALVMLGGFPALAAAQALTISQPSGGTVSSPVTIAGADNGPLNQVRVTISGSGFESHPEATMGGGGWSTAPQTLAPGAYTVTATEENLPLEEEMASVSFSIGSAPSITQDPASTSVAPGATATFTASASGASSVHWEVSKNGSSWSPVAGGTNETLSIPNVTLAESGNEYRATFSNSFGSSRTEPPAVLTVSAVAPVVTVSPEGKAVLASESVTLKAAATGNPAPSASWGVKAPGGTWTALAGGKTVTSGETTETSVVVNVTKANSGSEYAVEFKNSGGVAYTGTATLTLERSAPVITQDLEPEIAMALNRAGTLTSLASGVPTPTVEWKESRNDVSWSTIAGATSTTLAVPAQSKERRIWYQACFSNGVEPGVCSKVAQVTFSSPSAPVVVVNPLSASVVAGGTATFTAAASGVPSPSVQWEESGNGGATWAPIPGANGNVLTIAGATAARNGHQFRAVFTNEVPPAATSSPATLTVTTPVTPTPSPLPSPASLAAGFSWFPTAPHVGETVTFASTSTDQASPIVGLAWNFTGSTLFTPGSDLASTSFGTAGPHVVRLRATAANGLMREASQTINVLARQLNLMQPFPVVRMAGSLTSSGVRVTLLTVQAPTGATVSARCAGKHCPLKIERGYVLARAGRVLPVTLWRFQRFLRAGVVLQIKVYKAGQVGKYTTFTIRRGRLPVRVDECLDPSAFTPMACPGS